MSVEERSNELGEVQQQQQQQQPPIVNETPLENTQEDASMMDDDSTTLSNEHNHSEQENEHRYGNQRRDESPPKITYYRTRSLRTGLGSRLGFQSVEEMKQMRDPDDVTDTRPSRDSHSHRDGGRRLGDIIANGRYSSKNYHNRRERGHPRDREHTNRRGNFNNRGGRNTQKRAPKPSIEDLDRELEEYMNKK